MADQPDLPLVPWLAKKPADPAASSKPATAATDVPLVPWLDKKKDVSAAPPAKSADVPIVPWLAKPAPDSVAGAKATPAPPMAEAPAAPDAGGVVAPATPSPPAKPFQQPRDVARKVAPSAAGPTAADVWQSFVTGMKQVPKAGAEAFQAETEAEQKAGLPEALSYVTAPTQAIVAETGQVVGTVFDTAVKAALSFAKDAGMSETDLNRTEADLNTLLLGSGGDAGNLGALHAQIKAKLEERAPPGTAEAFDKASMPPTDRGPGITVHHGSPHQFQQFDTAKIGTGEGNQAVGHGLYFAEHPDVAKDYARTVKAGEAFTITDKRPDGTRGDTFRIVDGAGKTRGEFATIEEANAAADKMFPKGDPAATGHVYTSTIHGTPDEFLHWDKPLSEQSPHVQEALKKSPEAQAAIKRLGGDPTGEQVYRAMAEDLGGGPETPMEKLPEADKAASQALNQAGIKGNRYLDASSRVIGRADKERLDNYLAQAQAKLAKYEADGADPELIKLAKEDVATAQSYVDRFKKVTHNYVVFNHDDVSITHINGEHLADIVAKGHPGRIEESAGAGVALQYPNYDAFLKAARETGISDREIAATTGIASAEDFARVRNEEMHQYVEPPAHDAMSRVYAKGGQPYSSNAFGPGEKGVHYTDASGKDAHEPLGGGPPAGEPPFTGPPPGEPPAEPPPPTHADISATQTELADRLHAHNQGVTADRIETMELGKAAHEAIPDQAVREKLIHHQEQPDKVPLTPEEQALFDQHILPIIRAREEVQAKIADLEGKQHYPAWPALRQGEDIAHAPRFVKGKGSTIDWLLQGIGRRVGRQSLSKVGDKARVVAGPMIDNPKVAYYKDAVVNNLVKLEEAKRQLRNMQMLEHLKSDPGLDHLREPTKTSGFGQTPGWKAAGPPQLAGLHWHPRIANAINDAFKDFRRSGDAATFYAHVNRVLVGSMFYSPIGHILNVFSDMLVSKGAVGTLVDLATLRSFKAFGRAVREVGTLGKDYRANLRAGSSLQYGAVATENFVSDLVKGLEKHIKVDPKSWAEIARAGGYANPANLVAGILRTSRKFLWGVGDVLKLTRQYELEAKGMSRAEAIHETEKHIVSYRVPTEVAGQRWLSEVIQNPYVFSFSRYHYGLLKSLASTARDLAKGTPAERMRAVDSALMMGVVYLGYRAADDQVRKLFGDKNVSIKRSGVFGLADVVEKAAEGDKDARDIVQRIASLNPMATLLATLYEGKDPYTGRDVLRGRDLWEHPGRFAKEIGTVLGGKLMPIKEGMDLATGKTSPQTAILKELGVSDPSVEQVARTKKARHKADIALQRGLRRQFGE